MTNLRRQYRTRRTCAVRRPSRPLRAARSRHGHMATAQSARPGKGQALRRLALPSARGVMLRRGSRGEVPSQFGLLPAGMLAQGGRDCDLVDSVLYVQSGRTRLRREELRVSVRSLHNSTMKQNGKREVYTLHTVSLSVCVYGTPIPFTETLVTFRGTPHQ